MGAGNVWWRSEACWRTLGGAVKNKDFFRVKCSPGRLSGAELREHVVQWGQRLLDSPDLKLYIFQVCHSIGSQRDFHEISQIDRAFLNLFSDLDGSKHFRNLIG